MNNRVIIILIISIICSFFFVPKGAAQELSFGGLNLGLDAEAHLAPPDSVSVPPNVKHDWRSMVKQHRWHWRDTTISHPKFVDFCLNVYRWFDYTFNTYDSEWVSGTGKPGKVQIFSDNWREIYNFGFTNRPLFMVSNLYSNLGVQLNYYILSASYSIDMNTLFSNHSSKHKKLNFNVSVARLYLDAYFWENRGGAIIRKNTPGSLYNHQNDINFDGLSFRAAGVMGFYIFNSRKFCFNAPYGLSNYQLKSAGSWLAGASGTFYKADFDFKSLPLEIINNYKLPPIDYSLDYNAVNLIGGFSYNWVCNKHFLFNTTTLPGLGMSFSFSNSTEGRKDLFSASIRQMLSLTYSNRQFFITGNGTFHGNLFPSKDLALFSGIFNFQVSTGVRFKL